MAPTAPPRDHRANTGADADAESDAGTGAKADPKADAHAKPSGFLGLVETLGNKLPNPFWLFVILGILTLLSSWIGSAIGMSAEEPGTGETITIVNLLSSEGLSQIITEMVTNYTSFPPLGLILVVMLGVAIAEYSGLISAVIRAVVGKVGPRMLTFVIALAGVTGSIASDAVYVILIPLGALAFNAVGRSPVVGAMVAFASCSAGFNSSLILNITDVLLGGISTSAAQFVDPEYVVSPLANYFFVVCSAIVLSLIVTAVTEFFMNAKAQQLIDHSQIDTSSVTFTTAPDSDADTDSATGSGSSLHDAGSADADSPAESEAQSLDDLALSDTERAALRLTGIVAVLMTIGYFALMFIPGSPLQGEGGAVMESPLIRAVAVPITVAFFIMGSVYGLKVGTITSLEDFPAFMARGLKTLLPMMVLFFAVAQFLAWFKWSNLGSWTAIKGAELLQKADLPPLVLFAAFVLLVALINLFITSGSAQWALMAPIVVPMFMYIGYAPEVTQMLFRIGDSPSNIITPMSPYFALALMFIQRYYKPAGIGTLMSLALPYSIAMLIGWFLFFAVWYTIGLPLGPGTPMEYHLNG